MKKAIGSIFVISALLSSCSNNGEKAETKEAQDVEVIETNKTITLNKVSEDSYLDWRASHLGGISPRFGKIYVKDAEVLVNNGELTNAKLDIEMSSLTVDNFEEGSDEIEELKGHLLSPDFFNVETNPTSTFELTKIRSASGDFNSVVTGNLTILDSTKSITFNANVNVSNDEVSVESEDFSIDRTDWNLTYNVEGTEGVPEDYIISNDVGFTIHFKVTK